ncbi:hypothetical protein RKE25_23215 (plasmid) [Dyella sp. BiH032]|uniref:LPD29 domain-containing protein n=1 Tax=Dyella sp. BiH032 TaxID=3075430 RepID=UPI00289358EB|nr:LPD29 domain-containing protein [Dyella sp. BiH032]WNL48526.1 hypothetical protein RKE25_23215 [Dyella sp. BiH032]
MTISSLPVSQLVVGRRVKHPGHAQMASKLGTVVEVAHTAHTVVWEDGSRSYVNPGSFTGLRPMTILPIVVEPELIAGLIAKAERVLADKHSAEDARKAAFQQACADLLAANKHLEAAPDKYCVRTAAKNLRTELKLAKIKASVRMSRFSMGNSITVEVDKGGDLAAAEAIANKYIGTDFDGMTDCKTYRETPWLYCFGSTHYVHVHAKRES